MIPAISRNVQAYDLLLGYTYLQILDVLTTLAFLVHGVGEGNPVVQFLMSSSGSPFAGLIGVKVVAILLGVLCQVMNRFNSLRRANILFAVLVVWNLLALILSSVK
jgi:hypothetical protein